MKTTTATAHALSDGDISFSVETDDGEVVTLRTTRDNWRKLTQMILHQVHVSEENAPILETCGSA